MRDEDRTLRNLLALFDECAVRIEAHQKVWDALMDQLYGDEEPPKRPYRHHELRQVGTLPDGRVVVYRFGWSDHSGRTVRSWSYDWYESLHSKACLEKYNPEDPRIAGPESGDMEALAWIHQAQEAHDQWEARWKEVLGWSQETDDLVCAFYAAQRRERQLYMRRGLVLRHIQKVVDERMAEEQERNRQAWYAGGADANSPCWADLSRQEPGPVVIIDGRPFYYQSHNLYEGVLCQTYVLGGGEKREKDPHEGWDPMYTPPRNRELRDHRNERLRKKKKEKENDT